MKGERGEMDTKEEKELLDKVRQYLMQVALELEKASLGAKAAAQSLPEREKVWPHVQQMYTRLNEANFLLERFKSTIDEAVKTADESSHRQE
jgi:cell fate (sporulation/competence/biofilm development) regulator YmcA (YheA/YmcA/DUF963 family)